MGFRTGAFANIFKVDNKGNYSVASVSVSKKKKDSNEYVTEFQDGFVRLVGAAHEKMGDMDIPQKGVRVKIENCDVTRVYDANSKKTYTNFVIFDLELQDASNGGKSYGNSKSSAKPAPKKSVPVVEDQDDSEELPF